MKTITLNNWLSIGQELKKIGLLLVLIAVGVLIYSLWKQDTFMLFPFIGAFSTFTVTLPQALRAKDKACQWERFSLTLPISRKDVVTGQFRFFTELTALNFTFCTLVLLTGTILSHIFSFEKPIGFSNFLTLLPIVLSIGMLGQCFTYLISLIGKDGVGEMMQILGVIIATIPYAAPIFLLSSKIEDKQVLSYLTSGITVVLVVLFTGISYVISVKLMEKKEF